jgi:hypothetical protein
MPLQLIGLPVANATSWPIRLYNGPAVGPGLLELQPGQAAVVSVMFDRIRILRPTLPHPVYVQNPNVVVPPHIGALGYLGYFRPGPNLGGQPTYVLSVGAPNQNAMTYKFTLERVPTATRRGRLTVKL